MAARSDQDPRDSGRDGQDRDRRLWALVERQHGVVARRQLLEEGLTPAAIGWRIQTGRLHPVQRGVYAVGRPRVGRHGRWMAAVLAGGPGALLSHGSAAALWGFGDEAPGLIEISTPADRRCRRAGIRAHRRERLRADEVTAHEGISVTAPVRTLIDQATRLRPMQVERAVNEADKLGLIDPEALRAPAGRRHGARGDDWSLELAMAMPSNRPWCRRCTLSPQRVADRPKTAIIPRARRPRRACGGRACARRCGAWPRGGARVRRGTA